MRTWIVIALGAAAVFSGALSGPASAADTNDAAVIGLHITEYNAKNQCTGARPDCIDLVTSAPYGWYNVYAMIGNISDSLGIGGVQFGIAYDGAPGAGVDITGWTACADLEFPSGGGDGQPFWPEAGSGNLLTWDVFESCQNEAGGAILVGVFLMNAYSDDCLSVTPRPVDGRAKVGSCFMEETDITNAVPSPFGVACFGAGEGYNPCDIVVPAQPATWGKIKTLYQ